MEDPEQQVKHKSKPIKYPVSDVFELSLVNVVLFGINCPNNRETSAPSSANSVNCDVCPQPERGERLTTCHNLRPRVSGLGALHLSAGHSGATGGGGGQGKPQSWSAQQVRENESYVRRFVHFYPEVG